MNLDRVMFKNSNYIAHRRKTGAVQSLADHLSGVSWKTGEFASKVGMKEAGEIIGLLHDIGKASDAFDIYIRSAVGLINPDEDSYIDAEGLKGKVDHSTAGAQIIYRELAGNGNDAKFVAQVLALCIASHHSGLIDCIAPEGIDLFSKRMCKEEKRSHITEVLGKIDSNIKEDMNLRLQSKVFIQNITGKFMALRTGTDSRETFAFKCGLLIRFLYSCLIDADRLNTADFENPGLAKIRNNSAYADWQLLIRKLDLKLNGFDSEGINEVRRKISDECYSFSNRPKGLYKLTVPTGGGKTLASLRFALHHADKHKMDRIVYVLPYTTIIEQNADEIRKILEEAGEDEKYSSRIVLEHHSNLMPEKETASQKVLSENWDAPVVLTTNIQVLESLFGAGTRGARRLHQLANSVIIFDEVQAMPVKCLHMFNTAINFLVNSCGSSVVLCTATQPILDKIEPKSHALKFTSEQKMVQNPEKLFTDLRRVEVHDKTKAGGWSNEDIAELVFEKAEALGSILLIVNTKKSAREIYDLCRNDNRTKTYHLSTNMCPAHRKAVLNEIISNLQAKKPVVCISTQLIEAGVDISFGSVIRFTAGLDSIVQAAGRCNRHNEKSPALGQIYIINPANENIDSLEDIRIGKEKTERILDEFRNSPERFGSDILSQKAIEQYYQYYFYQRAGEMNYRVTPSSAAGREDDLYNMLSVNYGSVDEYKRRNKKAPDIPVRQAFMTAARSFKAIESAARGIVVPYGNEGKELIEKLCSAFGLEKQYKLLRQAQRFSVNVHTNELDKLSQLKAINEAQKGSGILYLDERYYSDYFGLSDTPVKDFGFLNA